MIDLDTADGMRALEADADHGMWVIRHDIDERVITRAYQVLQTFFALSPSSKAPYEERGSEGHVGYIPPKPNSERKELYHWAAEKTDALPPRSDYPARYPLSIWPDDVVAGASVALLDLHHQMLAMQLRVLGALESVLGASKGFLTSFLEDAPTVNRASHYLPVEDGNPVLNVWAIEHVDFGLITMLPSASDRGLEAKIEGEWSEVNPAPGHAVFNAGAALELLTAGAIPTPLHRVVPKQTSAARLSIVQFTHPAPWRRLVALDQAGRASTGSGPLAEEFFQGLMARRRDEKAAILRQGS